MDVPGRAENSDESKSVLMKDMIQQFITKSAQFKASKDQIKEYLTKIYDTDLLLNKEIYEWALQKIIEVNSNDASPGESEEKRSEKPLFCEDTVYHASLCCYALGTKDAMSYKKFFHDSKHHFDELSLSRGDQEDVDRYIIAKRGKTYFLAFLSEPVYSEWLKYKSFEHGTIHDYTHSKPL